MKKLLAILFTVVLAVTAFTTTAFATDSPEKPTGIVSSATAKDKNGNNVDIIVKNINPGTEFDAALENLKKDKNLNLKIADAYELSTPGAVTPSFPIEVTFNVTGINAGDKGFILFKDASGITEKALTIGNGVATVTLDSLGKFAFVVEDKSSTGTKPGDKSPQTSDSTAPIIFSLLALSFVVGTVAVKKIRTEA